MRRRGAPVSDFPVLEPSDDAASGLVWTPAEPARRHPTHSGVRAHVDGRSGTALGLLEAEVVDGLTGAAAVHAASLAPRAQGPEGPQGPQGPPGPQDWRSLVRHAGTAAAKLAAWLAADPTERALGFAGLSPGSVTQGWPHHGSTVVRLVWAPLDVVAGAVRTRDRWDTLRLSGRDLEPMRFDGGWTTTGRLRLRWCTVPVRVEVRIVPTAGERTWTHLVLASHGRFPRTYWSSGHRALAAIDTRSRRLLGVTGPRPDAACAAATPDR